jgi:hypothetical protein
MPTAAEVMDDATTQTGLTDFGDDSFREGLEILLASLRDEARLHERGRAFASWVTCRSACRSRTGIADIQRSTTCPSPRR